MIDVGWRKERSPAIGFFSHYPFALFDKCSKCTNKVNREGIQFVWDEKKNPTNRRKHGVSFEEAQTAFFDENAKISFDPDHSEDENRFLLCGKHGQVID